MSKRQNPQVFLDISINGGRADRMTFELFSDIVPKTAENFRALCTGERGLGASTQKPLHFKGSDFHRIVKGFVAQGGDFSRGDGSGGESIYGGKFPDENFKLKHDKPGVLSMANSGPDRNGSQFFITFNTVPHLNGKHVVFGKVVSGIDLLKKLEEVGSENGKPVQRVKIVDCGEISGSNTQIQRGEKEKKLRRSEGNSDGEGRVKVKRPASDSKRIKKRKHSSSDSDSYSSDSSDSQSYSSDSGSDSESYSSSSDTSSSSDYRHKRRRKETKKDNHKSRKRKSNRKKTKRQSRRTSRKSKWSSGSSSDDSKSSNTSSSSSDPENGAHRTKQSLQKVGREKAASTMLDKDKITKDARKDEEKVTTDNISHDGSKLSDKSGTRENDNGLDGTSRKTANRNSEDKSSKFREDPGTSSRRSPVRAVVNVMKTQMTDGASGADAADPTITDAGISRLSTEGIPSSNKPAPNHSKGLPRGSSPNGHPQRIRKGRGFTQQYSFARRYRTPSPERSPVRSRYYAGRNERENYFNRYGRNRPYNARSPVRRYRGSPRGSSPSRYPRRERSRSRSRSPVRHRDRGGYRRQSPRRSRSPMEQLRRDVSDRPQSSHGGGGTHGSSPPTDRGRSRSRSKSHGPSTSRSPEPAPIKREESTRYNRRHRSSSRSSSPAGSKGLVSY